MSSGKRAKRARAAAEFDIVRLAAELRAPQQTTGLFAWDLENIRAARSAQMTCSSMHTPAELAVSVKTDGSIFSALQNRIAPEKSLPVQVESANDTATARIIRGEAEPLFGREGISFSPETRVDVHEQLALHGFSVCTNVLTPTCDGRRTDIEIVPWPIEHVRFNRQKRVLETITEGGRIEEIRHGDGRWIVFASSRLAPWGWGALLPLALIWADRAYGIRDRSKTGTSHGNAKMIGELPPNIPIDSPEGAAFLLLLKTMHEALPYGIRPAGAKTEMIANTSTAWQIFKEIIDSNLSDAARVLLGHDGTVKAAGGNYIKDGYLFGVSADIVEGDVHTIERGVNTGAVDVWCALNFGSSENAPRMRYLLPDPDEDTLFESVDKRRKAFWEDIAAAKAAGCVVDQKYVTERALEYRIDPPTLIVTTPPDQAVVDESVAELAEKMTELQIDRCEHGHKNRCPLCKIERARDVELDEAGEAQWAIAWKPIGAPKSSSPNAPASDLEEAPEDPQSSDPAALSGLTRPLRLAR